jgi:hypothetical protein
MGPPGQTGVTTNLYAVVDGVNGTIARGSGVTAIGKLGVGEYVLDFIQDVAQCAYVGTLGSVDTYGGQGYGGITVARRPFDPNGVYVRTDDNNGPADRSFHLAVLC